MADYWIKWYHEIIDDPKMATLPDRLWRRFAELCLLAGKLCPDKSGKLPDARQIAWMLRMPTDDLQLDLEQLASTGLIEPIPGGWFIVNFQKRQQAASSTERVQRHRERKKKQQYYGDETQMKRNVTQINRLTEQSRAEEEATDTDIEELLRTQTANVSFVGNTSPDVIAQKIFTDVTGMATFPAKDEKQSIHAITALLARYDRQKIVAFLKPFYRAWVDRGYMKTNCAWLTEWAVAGEIPTKNTKPQSQYGDGTGLLNGV